MVATKKLEGADPVSRGLLDFFLAPVAGRVATLTAHGRQGYTRLRAEVASHARNFGPGRVTDHCRAGAFSNSPSQVDVSRITATWLPLEAFQRSVVIREAPSDPLRRRLGYRGLVQSFDSRVYDGDFFIDLRDGSAEVVVSGLSLQIEDQSLTVRPEVFQGGSIV
jgi:hypothetical protein